MRPTSPPRWRGCCCAAEDLDEALAVGRAPHRAPRSGCRRPRSSCRRSTETSGGSRSRCARARASSAPCSCPPTCRRRRCARLQERVVPSLEALLAAAIERDELLGESRRGGGTAAHRRAEDGAPAVRLARPALAADRDHRPPPGRCRAARSPPRSAASWPASITQEAQRLSQLIDNLLDLSRLEAGAAEPQRDWCDLREVIHAAVDELGAAGRTRSSCSSHTSFR